jgi:hypothetical protein
MYDESDWLASSHNIGHFQSPIAYDLFSLRFPQSAISNGWLTDPGCSLLEKEATSTSLGRTLLASASDAPTGVAGHVFKYALIKPPRRLLPAASSLRPIWHRVL